MANGETITEIKSLLAEDGAIKTTTALRLSLDLQLQIFERQNKQDERIKALEEKVKAVEDSSIVMWVNRNPKLSFFLVSLYLVVASLVDFKEAIAKAIGL